MKNETETMEQISDGQMTYVEYIAYHHVFVFVTP